MSSSSSSKKIGASAALREKLLAEHVYSCIPDIANTVPLGKYLDLLKYNEKTLRSDLTHASNFVCRYILLQKCCVLALQKLPGHSSFNSPSLAAVKDEALAIGSRCLGELEIVVRELDKQSEVCAGLEAVSLATTELNAEVDLIDEFDGASLAPITTAPSISSAASAPMMPWSTALTILSEPDPSSSCIFFPVAADGETDTFSTSNSTASTLQPLSLSPPPATTKAVLQRKTLNTYINGLGLSDADILILKSLSKFSSYRIPVPHVSILTLYIGVHKMNLVREDFHISFAPFLQSLPPALKVVSPAIEANRCFFLHLGVAVQYHPFVVQACFRHIAAIRLQETHSEVARNILPTIHEYAGFVDANAFMFIWPEEFSRFRIILVSGSSAAPIFCCFAKDGMHMSESLLDIIIHCDGNHFTLLNTSSHDTKRTNYICPLGDGLKLLKLATNAGLVVNYLPANTQPGEDVPSSNGILEFSLAQVFSRLLLC